MLKIIGVVLLMSIVFGIIGILQQKMKLISNKGYMKKKDTIKDSFIGIANRDLSENDLKKIIIESTFSTIIKKSRLIEKMFFKNSTLKSLNENNRILANNLAKTGIELNISTSVFENLKNCKSNTDFCNEILVEIKAVYADQWGWINNEQADLVMILLSKKRFLEGLNEINEGEKEILLNDINENIKTEKSFRGRHSFENLKKVINKINTKLNGKEATDENLKNIYSKLKPKYTHLKIMNKDIVDYGIEISKL